MLEQWVNAVWGCLVCGVAGCKQHLTLATSVDGSTKQVVDGMDCWILRAQRNGGPTKHLTECQPQEYGGGEDSWAMST